MNAPTLLRGVDATRYHADDFGQVPTLSASIAHVLDSKSPEHAHSAHPRLGGVSRRATKAMDHGTLSHRLLLGSGPDIVTVQADDWRTKAAQEARDEARERGAVPVLEEDYEAALATADKLRVKLASVGIVLDGESEVVALWTETAEDGTEVQCRGMFDHIRAGAAVVDLKSTRDANPRSVVRSIDSYGYAVQHAAYTSALRHIRPDMAGRESMTFVFYELEPPFGVAPVRLDGPFRQLGERRWKRAVNLWAKCLRENDWPGYADGVLTVEAPPWALKADMDRMLGAMSASGNAAEDFLFGEG